MSAHKLKNAPLKEVIFELFWQGKQKSPSGIIIDDGYELAVGKFHDKIQKGFPVKKQQIDTSGPIRTFGIPVFQYWAGEMTWPVVQHGPGVLAINDVEANYTWDGHFKPLIQDTIKKLCASYEVEPSFERVKLQYFDAFDIEDGNVSGFLKENLQTEFGFKFPTPGKEIGMGVFKQFELNDNSLMTVNIQTGKNASNQLPALLLTMYVEWQGKISASEIITWADFAHKNTSIFFKKMLEPSYYASLDK